MGVLDFLSSLIGKKVARLQRRPPAKAVVLEEIKLNLERKRKAKAGKKKIVRKREIDELKKFQEVVEILRQYADLPPVEEMMEEKEEKKPKEEKPAEKKEEPKEEVKKEVKKEVRKEKKEVRRLSLAEREKIIRLAKKKLERSIMDIINKEVKELGIKSFKEKARRRRVARDFLREKEEEIEKTFRRLLEENIDILRDDVVNDIAQELYKRIRERIAVEEKIVVEPEEKEESPKDELLSLLGGGEEKREEKEGEDELLKLLEG